MVRRRRTPNCSGGSGRASCRRIYCLEKSGFAATLVEETGEPLGFEFALDRSGDNAREVGDAMEKSVEAFEGSLWDHRIAPSEWTEYVYETAVEIDSQDANRTTRFQLDAIPYVLAFDEN